MTRSNQIIFIPMGRGRDGSSLVSATTSVILLIHVVSPWREAHKTQEVNATHKA